MLALHPLVCASIKAVSAKKQSKSFVIMQSKQMHVTRVLFRLLELSMSRQIQWCIGFNDLSLVLLLIKAIKTYNVSLACIFHTLLFDAFYKSKWNLQRVFAYRVIYSTLMWLWWSIETWVLWVAACTGPRYSNILDITCHHHHKIQMFTGKDQVKYLTVYANLTSAQHKNWSILQLLSWNKPHILSSLIHHDFYHVLCAQ